jgi:predicted Rdx family selenoprotein
MSTFSTSLGEVALQPSTGGTFIVTIHHRPQAQEQEGAQEVVSTVLWDRKTDGGFPETKELKRRVRDVIEPGRDLGHVDRHHSATKQNTGAGAENTSTQSGDPTTSLADKKSCEDCN